MRTRFYSTPSEPRKLTQGAQKENRRPQLSKEARAAVNARRHLSAQKYRSGLDAAWSKINEVTENLATTHHKSVRRVRSHLHLSRQAPGTKRTNAWNAFCWKKSQEMKDTTKCQGKDVLQDLVHSHREEYGRISSPERKSLVADFEEYKATKTKAFRVSAKSRVNDIAQTLTAVRDELDNLKSRSGVETLLFSARGTTDLPFTAVSFATEGVHNFLEQSMKTDQQEFLGKMEGYALQGIKGVAKNHQKRVSEIRANIRSEITECLRAITGDDSARMEWKHYWRNVVMRYKVAIKGWPANIPFRNLSEVSSALPELESLLRKWKMGKIYWEPMTDAELQSLDDERNAQIENQEIEPPAPRRRRSDYGKKRPRETVDIDEQAQKCRKSTVSDDDDESPVGNETRENNDGSNMDEN
ncbi:hypothetical protein M378DRAFT_92922 [Amanita muscaria Koide BX008]|uniref:Uncharacterized protein n=1 Tax=Amanita muscaria (strain Koide BX008) TaxID=946122 RepID=A0A0C2WCD3_AMAMK|nr:hypothetical protein M378DRAFT_92922 [Amanita muscaria Koide BX008]